MRKDYSPLPGAWRLLCCALLVAAAAGAAPSPSSIGLVSLSNPSILGQGVTIVATVTTGATGKVTFYDGATMLGVSALAGGQATFTTSLLPSGPHNLRAHYSGDANFLASDSPGLVQSVNALPGNGFQQVGVVSSGPLFADFNGDGKVDFATATAAAPGNTNIWLGKGDGTFLPGANVIGSPVAVGDFNGDGFTDLLVAGTGPSALLMWPGNGDGTFGASINTGLTVNLVGMPIVVADFNGDGKADIAYVTGGAGPLTVVVALGNGNGSFQAPVTVAAGVAVVAGDFNRDGKADLAIASGTSTGLSVLLGNGDGTFRPAITSPGGVPGASIAVADFNGDGNPDVAASGTNILAIFLGNGDGTFRKPLNYQADGAGSLGVGDFNGDGQADLAVNVTGPIAGYPSGLEILLGNGDATFQQPVFYAGFFGSLAVADFNGDGRADVFDAPIVFLGAVSPDLIISSNRNGSFAPGAQVSYTLTVSNLPFAPTNGTVTVTDTLPLGVIAGSISGLGWTCSLGTLTCSRSDSLAAGHSYPPISIAVSVSDSVPGTITNVARVSGGGDTNAANNQALDTIVLRTGVTALGVSPNPALLGQPVSLISTLSPGSTGQVTFYDGIAILGVSPIVAGQASLTTPLLADGSHSLHARFNPDAASLFAGSSSPTITMTVAEGPLNGFRPPLTYPVPLPLYVMTGDFNGDGKIDLAFAGGRLLTVLLGNGDGTFHDPISSTVPFVSAAPMVADFNGDGRADIVISSSTGNAPGSINVFLGNGDGTFRPGGVFAPASAVIGLAVSDFNGDGKADVAYISGAQSRVAAVMLGNGDGTFAAPLSYVVSTTSTHLVAADFNGDGKADLALANVAGISVLLGNGDGTFQTEMFFAEGGGTAINFLAVGDFNGDGKPDLAMNYFNLTLVTVLLGRGDGSFQASPASYPGTLVAAGDLNGDGKADLVLLVAPNSVSVRLGNGDGTFQAPLIVNTGGGPGPVAIADFSGDGRADMAVANGGSNNVGVVLSAVFGSQLRVNLTVWRPLGGIWYVNPPSGVPVTQQWGLLGDIPVAGDFDHDGVPDFAVWRPSLGTWFVIPSGSPGVPVTRSWGLPGDIPVPGDFDGDGKTDFAVWRPANGTWYIIPSSNPANPVIKPWGLANDIPVVGDFDGDGKADFAVWRPSEGNWYITLSSTGATVVKQWGLAGDVPVAADFDGDGKADFAVWRPSNSTWYITPSSHPAVPIITPFGLPGDIPVPHDYDGDGKADVAVWRSSSGTWFIIPSAAPTAPLTIQWGLPNDVPIYKPAGN